MVKQRKRISFILVIALMITGFGFLPGEKIYAAPSNEVDLSTVDGDITITRDAMNIAASTQGGILTSGSAAQGIKITGANNTYGVIVSGEGANDRSLNITLDNVSITKDGPMALTNSAIVNMTLEGNNILNSSTSAINISAGLSVTSPNALTIMGNGVLTAMGSVGAGIGGNGVTSTTHYAMGYNGDNITIGGSVSISALSQYGAGIGGGGVNGVTGSSHRFGGSEYIEINDNANVTAKSSNASGIGGGANTQGNKGVPYCKEVKNIKITGDAIVNATGESGAGIGSGYKGTVSSISISGNACVNATNTKNGAGIGGGNDSNGIDIRISGNSNVSASGLQNGAGIGGGNGKDGSDIHITDNAKVNASGQEGAGIGGGKNAGTGSNISISGNACVNATSTKNGAGIGGGSGNGKCFNITISDNAAVNASGVTGAGIGSGGGGSQSPTASGINISGGFVTANSTYGDDIGSGSSTSNLSNKSKNIFISGGSVFAVNDKISTTPKGSGGVDVYKVKVPVLKTGTKVSLKGNLDISVPLNNSSSTYKAKTVSSDEGEHGNSFSNASAYIYLPAGTHKDIKVGTYGNGFADVSASPSGNENIIYWEQPSIPTPTFTVTLDVNGGEKLSNNKLSVTQGDKYGTLSTPKRAGYKFNGWYTAKSGGSKITKESNVTINKDHTLYARWKAEKYKLLFKSNGGKLNKKSKAVSFGSKYGTLPKAKRTGYVFKGWYTKNKGGKKVSKNTKMKSTKTLKLYAKWKKNGKIVNCKYVHLRKALGNSKVIKGYIQEGTKVSVLKKTKYGWYKVKVGKKTGYIYKKYVMKYSR